MDAAQRAIRIVEDSMPTRTGVILGVTTVKDGILKYLVDLEVSSVVQGYRGTSTRGSRKRNIPRVSMFGHNYQCTRYQPVIASVSGRVVKLGARDMKQRLALPTT